MTLAVLAAVLLHQDAKQLQIAPPIASRFQLEAPLPALSAVHTDAYNDGMGLAQQMARAKGLQGRMLWIDGTANLDRVNSSEKIQALVAKIADAGFNTIVFDIKPISGQVLYKSSIAPKITEWRGQTLPEDYDPVPDMADAAKAHHLQVLVSMNAFSEGHSMFKVGPGYEQPDHQSVLYDALPIVSTSTGVDFPLAESLNVAIKDDAHLYVYADASKFRHPQEDLFAETVRADGTILDGFEKGGAVKNKLTVPEGGSIVAGKGAAAVFLRAHTYPGMRLEYSTKASFVRTGDRPTQYPLMMNPNDPAVQERGLAIVNEVLTKYAVDGMLYDDRLRYANLDADFSDLSRSLFETYVGRKINWPDDVFKYTLSPTLKKGIVPGPYYDAWFLWRALQMRNWVARVRNQVNHSRPGALFGIYAGSWYGEYPTFGTNYAGPDLEAGFWFLTPKYQKTGFASLLDILVTGCYYTTPTIYDAMAQGKSVGSTVESAGQLSNRVADDQCWTYAGLEVNDFKGDTVALGKALQAACASSQGVMVFDLSHDFDPLWPVFKRAFMFHAAAPTARRADLVTVRRLRQRYRDLKFGERPVPISTGSSGTGF